MSIEHRLALKGWKQSITTSTHSVWFKGNWQCNISQTRQVKFIRHFSRVMKIDTVELMRGEVEEGIE